MHLSMAVSMNGSSGDAAPAPPAVNPNLLTKTEQFDAAIWTKAGSTVVANSGVDPLGSLAADAITDVSGTASTAQISTVAAATGGGAFITTPNATWARISVSATLDIGAYTFSVWLKDPTLSGSQVRLRIDISGGFVRVALQDVGDNAVVFAWGAKLETGASATGTAETYGVVN